MRPLGAYWGGVGEQVDLLSGNLNYTVPLINAKSRGGWGVIFALSYNSQNWRQDQGGTWNLGRDVGFGLGWRFMAGSITPVYSGTWALDHFIFTDQTGAEYPLDHNSNGVWTSLRGFYGSYDANTSRLYFPDGSYWCMSVQSSGQEQDAGTLYPMYFYDSNGNYIKATYAAGLGVGTANSSARITGISDGRTWSTSYSLAYNTDTIPHLTAVQTSLRTGESYTIAYQSNQPLSSPFDQSSFGTASLLQSVATTGLGVATSFQYGLGTGEMTQMTTPLGGSIAWQYRTYTYSGSRSYREIMARQVTASAGATPLGYNITLDSGANLHGSATVSDLGAQTSKVWTFQTTAGSTQGVALTYKELDSTSTALLEKDYTWTQDALGIPYVGSVLTTLNPGAAYAVQAKTSQTLDIYGNVTQTAVYDYGNLSTPARTYNYTYLHQANPNYLPWYIRNRLSSATVTSSTGTVTLVSNFYDHYTCTAPSGSGSCIYPPVEPLTTAAQYVPMHDDSNYGVSFYYRGNVTSVTSLSGAKNSSYYTTGVPNQVTDGSGRTVSVSSSSATNYSLPEVLAPGGNGGLATSISYASSWAVTSVVSPNGATTSTTYDSYGRPETSTVADGAKTTYTYTYNPNIQAATITNNGSTTQWTRTTLDGFGRTVLAETGNGNTTVSQAETQYAACACSPLGKLWRTARPHAPNASPQWTTYAYDARGRTISVTLPDGSVIQTVYQGNQTTVTDAAGKWKTSTSDVFGNLILVAEPNPAGGTNFTTTYTYNSLNQLTQVSMPRPYLSGTYTQTRTFTWTGMDLTSETTPEAGTVRYQYDGAHHLTQRTNARGQISQYTYDVYGRLTQDPANTYYWDSNPFDTTGFSTHTAGRLAAVGFASGTGEQFSYQYSYNVAGRVAAQRLQVTPIERTSPNSPLPPVNFDLGYTWDNEGKMMSVLYPGDQQAHTYQYDAMARLNTLTMPSGHQMSATWGPAGELLSVNRNDTIYYGDGSQGSVPFGSEARTYNSLGQLTRITSAITPEFSSPATAVDVQYIYPAGQNNGRISQMIDGVTGETVNYTYDALNRLATARTTSGTWGNAYTFDGWGNLTGKAVTVGTAPYYSTTYDPSLNQPTGSPLPSQPPRFPVDWQNRPTSVALTWESLNLSPDDQGSPTAMGSVTYDPSGKRVFWTNSGICQIYLYGITGEKLVTYNCGYSGTGFNQSFWSTEQGRSDYFMGKPVLEGGIWVFLDRLGSVRADAYRYGFVEQVSYFPYGEKRTSTPYGAYGAFATYERDSTAAGGPGLDYARARYYNSVTGSFTTPDPMGMAAANPADPGSWNRYAYVQGDPVNFNDRSGLSRESADFCSLYPFDSLCDPLPRLYGTAADIDEVAEWTQEKVDARKQYRESQKWAKAVAVLSNGNDLLHRTLNGQVSAPCQGDLDALSKIGVSSVGIMAMTNDANWVDAYGDQDPASGLAVPGTDLYNLLEEHGGTIAQYVSWTASRGGVTAATALPGSELWGNIYFNSSYVMGLSTAQAAALLMHEAVHTLGPIDTAIQTALFGVGSPEVGKASSNIGVKFLEDCFQ